jgi:hypothetical protein
MSVAVRINASKLIVAAAGSMLRSEEEAHDRTPPTCSDDERSGLGVVSESCGNPRDRTGNVDHALHLSETESGGASCKVGSTAKAGQVHTRAWKHQNGKTLWLAHDPIRIRPDAVVVIPR